MPPAEFAHEVLVERLHAADVVVGRNFTFGHRAEGDVAALTRLGRAVRVRRARALDLISDDGVTFSSTYIRSCIDAGDVAAAAAALGRPHRVEGVVVHGDQRGRELGFPTANVATRRSPRCPADGVYAGGSRSSPASADRRRAAAGGDLGRHQPDVLRARAHRRGLRARRRRGLLRLRGRPSTSSHRLRGQERFDGVEPLVAQMHARRRPHPRAAGGPVGPRRIAAD